MNGSNELTSRVAQHEKLSDFDEPGAAPIGLSRHRRGGMCDEQWEIIEFCVRLARLFNVPRSVGEIFGFVFCSDTPVTFENVVTDLGISSGSASHGLRLLRQFGALKLTYVARDRRDFYVAETSARRLFAGFLSETVLQEATENRLRLRKVHDKLTAGQRSDRPLLLDRVKLLMVWTRQGSAALQAAMETLDADGPAGGH